MTNSGSDVLAGRLLLVGIGAQKAGTSWLHRQLASDPRTCMPIKELHYFDSVYRPDLFGHWPETALSRLRQHAAELTLEDGPQALEACSLLLDHARLLQDRDFYLPFFAKRLQDAHRIFGEFTPSYATLGADGFKAIRGMHDHVKIIFVLRDPVARLISGVRHEKRMAGEDATAEDVMNGLDDPAHAARCDYGQTLEHLDAIFEEPDHLVIFLEEIFAENFVQKLGDFIGLDGLSADATDEINISPPQKLLDAERMADLRSRLDPTYRYCRSRFGSRIPSSWLA